MNKFCRIIVSSLFLIASSVFADIERVSVSSSGGEGNDDVDNFYSISADGRFVAFSSSASNLVDDDTNASPGPSNKDTDVFVHDRDTGITERVSVSSTGEQGNGSSGIPSISANGRFVAFESFASNLVDGDSNGNYDAFVHDRITGITERVSISSSGTQGNGSSGASTISADGRFIVFDSGASNLVDGDTNGVFDLFVHDRVSDLTERVNITPNRGLGNGITRGRVLSADARIIAFSSTSSNLVDEDTNNTFDVFAHDRDTNITKRVSVSSTGEQGNSLSSQFGPSISADGRFVAFESFASNLVPGDTDGNQDAFLHDLETGLTERVDHAVTSDPGEDPSSSSPSISADGRFVAFEYGIYDHFIDRPVSNNVYVFDRETELTELVSVNLSGVLKGSFSYYPKISADARFVAFYSREGNLVEGDTNQFLDIFVAENPLTHLESDLVVVEKLINNEIRDTQDSAAQLATGTLYRQSYRVTNNSLNRIYQVKVFENGNLACNFYALNSGQTRQRCDTFETVLDGKQHVQVNVTAKVSGSGDALASSTDVYYTGLNVNGELRMTHRINNVNADILDQAPTLSSSQATVSYKVENIGEIELYQVKTYHDPVSPVNSGWNLQCVLGPMKPGQVRYCKRDISLTDSGLNQAAGRVQGRNAIRSATDVVNASNPTYFIVP